MHVDGDILGQWYMYASAQPLHWRMWLRVFNPLGMQHVVLSRSFTGKGLVHLLSMPYGRLAAPNTMTTDKFLTSSCS